MATTPIADDPLVSVLRDLVAAGDAGIVTRRTRNDSASGSFEFGSALQVPAAVHEALQELHGFGLAEPRKVDTVSASVREEIETYHATDAGRLRAQLLGSDPDAAGDA